ncbi:MAG: CRISPR-associated endonuclease Cas2 [Bacteroidetes bacterium]|nr:CRISPR-associated endonuclease Cas2 [Bacteroidota bacterium]MXW83444.1 CRISPR-associated endonuclease Cas2 [Rhodothermaceae bacterium]MDE2671170.1 CRISPR-associated endonuclease Cas2 [Bacteroidota bacterium]MXX58610.1 CRISPR-associated endonuclease Cas2 [Rhodothermaceae bacterium]MYD19688.1 CRISPR-associated endonuclease Cas2 [Rhodothermaceae bacterium]
MARERLYVVTYDISDSKRWRNVFRLLKGFGHWMQLSVFQCRLTARRRSEMMAGLECEMNMAEDHVLIIDLGPADGVEVKVESLGKPYEAPKRQATVV